MESTAERLKKKRLEKGLSLEEVQKKTKIHLNILQALEGDSLTHLSPVYLQGFLKIYCKFLGVDPKDFMPGHKEPKPKAAQAPVIKSAPSSDREDKKTAVEPLKFPEFLKNASLKLGSFRPSRNLKRGLIFVLVVFVASFGLFKLGKTIASRRQLAAAQSKAQAKKERESVKVTPKPQAQEVKQTSAPARSTEIRMTLKARENCLVALKVDGKTVFHRVLEKGRSESWKAKERMDLSLGNAGVVELQVDGQLFTNLGRRGQALKNIVITKKGLDIGR